MSKFEIKCFYQHLPPYPNAGAPRSQAIVGGLASFVSKNGFDVQVYVYSVSDLQEMDGGAKVVGLWAKNVDNSSSFVARLMGDLWLGMVAGFRMSLTARSPQSYVLISSPSFVSAMVLAVIVRARKVKYFLDIRDIYPDVYAEADLIKVDGFMYKWLCRFVSRVYQGAAGIICPTEGLARLVSSRGGRDVFVVYNGFRGDLINFPINKRQKFTLCFHGILSTFQDVETIIEVARFLILYDVDIVVVGYGKKESVLKSANLDNIKLYGKRSHEETLNIVSSCHIGLCLRRDENISKDAFPVKVWECLGLGIPSIVTPPCEAGNFLEENSCGAQFPAGDVSAISNYVLRLKSAPGLLNELSQNARSVAPGFTHQVQGYAAAEYFFGRIESDNLVRG